MSPGRSTEQDPLSLEAMPLSFRSFSVALVIKISNVWTKPIGFLLFTKIFPSQKPAQAHCCSSRRNRCQREGKTPSLRQEGHCRQVAGAPAFSNAESPASGSRGFFSFLRLVLECAGLPPDAVQTHRLMMKLGSSSSSSSVPDTSSELLAGCSSD